MGLPIKIHGQLDLLGPSSLAPTRSTRWACCILLLAEPDTQRDERDVVACNAGIHACQRCSHWRQGLRLFAEVKAAAGVILTVSGGFQPASGHTLDFFPWRLSFFTSGGPKSVRMFLAGHWPSESKSENGISCFPLTHHLGGDFDHGRIMRPAQGTRAKPQVTCATSSKNSGKDEGW